MFIPPTIYVVDYGVMVHQMKWIEFSVDNGIQVNPWTLWAEEPDQKRDEVSVKA